MQVGEPPEYNYEDKYEAWRNSEEVEEWAVPMDNVRVERVPHASRFERQNIPGELLDKKSRSIKTYLRECVEYFSEDYTNCSRTYGRSIPVQNKDNQSKIESGLVRKDFCDIEASQLTQSQTIFAPSSSDSIPKPEGVQESLVNNCDIGGPNINVCTL